MQPGEYWIDDSGQTIYADGDIGDKNHELIAWEAALGLNPEENKIDRDHFMCCRLSRAEARLLRMRGVDPKAIAYFSGPNPDPRYYAVKEMGWIRAASNSGWFRKALGILQLWDFNDEALRRIQRADIWDDDPTDEAMVAIEQVDRRLGTFYAEVPERILRAAQSAAQLKAYVAGYRSGLEGVCRCRRR